MVRFGTDGWRAVIGDEFTFANVRRFGQALGTLAGRRGWSERGIVVGYDRRFMSGEFARLLAEECSAGGLRTRICREPCPTPAAALAARQAGAALAAIVTASHNPYWYNGIKLRDAAGAPAAEDLTGELEAILAEGGPEAAAAAPAAAPLPDAVAPAAAGPPAAPACSVEPACHVEPFDPFPGYRDHVAALVDLEAIERHRPGVIHDAMHGSAAGWLGRLAPGVTGIRQEPDPLFGGIQPEPILANLAALGARVREARSPAIGLATDGDGDRLAAIAEDGSFIDPHHLYALLYLHMVEVRGFRGAAVRTVTTTTMIDRLAESRGLAVRVTPVGFKYIAPLLKDGTAAIGGEESGGVGFAFHLPERDGVFAALMLLEHLARTGRSLCGAVARLREKAGNAWLGRTDIQVPAEVAEAMERGCVPPGRLAGEAVCGWERLDGLKLRFADGAWLHVRASHTEPVLRLYAEAGSPARLTALLEAGKHLVTAGGSSPPGAPPP